MRPSSSPRHAAHTRRGPLCLCPSHLRGSCGRRARLPSRTCTRTCLRSRCVHAAIRSADPHRTLFLDGNTYATDFAAFPADAPARWPNATYAIHDYSVYGFPSAPEPYARTEEQRRCMHRSYERKRAWMDAHGLCVWNGEWGPVYARREYDGEDTDAINERRYNVLSDQQELYHKDRLSWSIWLYKDIGFQGMVHVAPATPYMAFFKDFLAKKHRLAADAWGADDTYVRGVYEPLVRLIEEDVPEEDYRRLYPYSGATGDIPPSIYEGLASRPSTSGLHSPRASSPKFDDEYDFGRDSDDDSGEYSPGAPVLAVLEG